MSATNTRIMIIDDNEDDYEAVSRGFRSVGLNTPLDWYKKPIEAYNNLRFNMDDLPGIILLDLNMPGIDGLKVLELIKSVPRLKAIPVLILTTSDSMTDVSECYESGASSYIQKPLTFDKMLEICASIKEYWFNTAII